ncbi:MAG: hypothetical protein IJM34_13375 [Lachnospiraceae bacterium]|nr:hypothetical protein [Lachnospiraceae bacterium]
MKKILIVSMPAMAETAGPGSRCRILAEGFKNAGIIRNMADELIASEETRSNVRALGEKLIRGGGVKTIVNSLN